MEDGGPDIAQYNDELEALGDLTWFNGPWLFIECYLYRRVSTSFHRSTHWKSYDVFHRQKLSTFRSSLPAVLELSHKYQQIVSTHSSSNATEASSEEEELLFREMVEICLWGNATDLSLLTTLTYEDIQKLQGAEARKKAEINILANDLSEVYQVLKHAKENAQPGTERRVDIVLDNSGFELFVDLVLAGYLLETKLATTIILHPKTVPWFVSDVLPHDFLDILSALANPTTFFSEVTEDGIESPDSPMTVMPEEQASWLTNLFQNLSSHHAEGRLLLRPNPFWTTAHSFHRLPHINPELKSDLDSAELVIYKGDLNYRKLTADAMWPPTTPFKEAIGDMANGGRVLALRTCKADVVAGLEAGVDERLREETGELKMRKWAWGGKWALVQFVDGKKL